MKTGNSNKKEKAFSFQDIATQLGVSVEEVIQTAKEGGLIDSNGMPTEEAINEGLLIIEPEDWFTNN